MGREGWRSFHPSHDIGWRCASDYDKWRLSLRPLGGRCAGPEHSRLTASVQGPGVRLLSFTEIDTLLTCQAQHDFQYGDQLAGSSLRAKSTPPLLSAGRAWGAAVAAWHSHPGVDGSGEAATQALKASLEADAAEQCEAGVYDPDEHRKQSINLMAILLHYTATVERVQMEPVTERRLLVPIPSRTGRRDSSRYRLIAFLDATESTDDGPWIDEFKLRNRLTPADMIVRSRQIRWYAWAYWQETGVRPVGVWVNERLHQAPKPARVLASGKPSHAKDQLATAESYEALCLEHEVDPVPTTVEHLRARKWQQRVPVMFRDRELEAAGQELVSAARLVAQMDSGALTPLRNVKRSTCDWCGYKEICESPRDDALVDALFDRRPAKRDLSDLNGGSSA